MKDMDIHQNLRLNITQFVDTFHPSKSTYTQTVQVIS